MLSSPLEPNVRGLNQALEYLDKEDVIPLFIVATRIGRDGMKTIILDASPLDAEEEIRVGVMATCMQVVASRLRG